MGNNDYSDDDCLCWLLIFAMVVYLVVSSPIISEQAWDGLQIVGEYLFGNAIVLAIMIGVFLGIFLVLFVNAFRRFNWTLDRVKRTKAKVKVLREKIERWDEAYNKQNELLEKFNKHKGSKKQKQDLALKIEESRAELQALKDEGCHLAQKELDDIFRELGYEFPTEERERLERMGATN